MSNVPSAATGGNHTPGWYEDGLLFIGTDNRGNGRGGFYLNQQRRDGAWEYTDTECEANTRLAAAAPDLLAACAAIAETDYTPSNEIAEGREKQVAEMKALARAAIAKAKGGVS